MPIAAALPYIAAAATTVAGVASSRSQASAARAASASQVGAANDQLALDKAVYQDQRSLQAPQIRAGAEAQARQMLMLGYTPDQVKNHLKTTYASIDGGATLGAPQQPVASQRIPGSRFWNEMSGEWEPAFQQVAAPAQNDTQFDWVDSYNPQAFLESTPGYQFRRDEGQQGLERSASARGRLFSGATGKALTRYNQDYASGEWGNLFNQFGRLSGQGTDAANTVVNVAGQYGQNAGQAIGNAGDARASGYLRAANAQSDMYGSIARGVGSIYGIGKQQGFWGA